MSVIRLFAVGHHRITFLLPSSIDQVNLNNRAAAQSIMEEEWTIIFTDLSQIERSSWSRCLPELFSQYTPVGIL
ncbi:hypothetical protein CEXT_558801 [Caerostris extrusa]|uniref:Uncharacterized protein n=1 Tax=Caerostris extrusa TaxID=172846 RepID=A0AAV4RLG2_CAEEX|nr:hypothetical protein CEXT_558801 [Caerostris extrusa]